MEKVNGMQEQVDNINREMEILQQNQKEMIGGKNTALVHSSISIGTSSSQDLRKGVLTLERVIVSTDALRE